MANIELAEREKAKPLRRTLMNGVLWLAPPLAALQSERDRLLNQCASLSDECASLSAQCELMSGELEILRGKSSRDLRDELVSLHKEARALRSDLASTTKESAALREEREYLLRQIDTIGPLNDQLRSIGKECADLRAENTVLQRRLASKAKS